MRKTLTRVKILENPYGESVSNIYDVKVVDLLSEQFTVEDKGKIRFIFYRDKGVTWEESDETSNSRR